MTHPSFLSVAALVAGFFMRGRMGGMLIDYLRPLLALISCILLLFSVGILLSAYEFWGAASSDPSRYQLVFVPVMAALCGIPLLTVAAVFYQLGKATFGAVDKCLMLFGCTIYLLSQASFIAAIFLSAYAKQ
jgi:hypothetical protein